MNNRESAQKLWELIKEVKFAMLTTVDKDGTLRSRPMTTQKESFDGDLWFFTRSDSEMVSEIQKLQTVNLSYADPNKTYISVSGYAELVRDRQKIEQFWHPGHAIWFPEGKDDPNLALLRVVVQKAEYWDTSNTFVGRMIDFVQTAITGDQSKMGENEKLKF